MMSSESDSEIFLTQNSYEGSIAVSSQVEELLMVEEQNQNADNAVDELFEYVFGDEPQAAVNVASRGITVVNDAEVEERNRDRIPLNTRKSTAWAVNVSDEWAKERNRLPVNTTDRFVIAPSSQLLKTLCDYELCFWLSKFVYEIRKTDKTEYPPNSLYQLCAGLQRHLRENGLPHLKIFENYQFKLFQDSLDSEMKRLTSKGIGCSIKQAEPIAEDDEEIMWEKGVLGEGDPKTLSNTVIFLIGKYFSLRSGEEHRSLTFNQFKVIEGSGPYERSKLQYTSFGEKNYAGGLQHRNLRPKSVEHYDNPTNPSRCLVRLFQKYRSKCKIEQDSPLYLSPKRKVGPDDDIWYTTTPIGKNTLRKTVSEVCAKAGIKGYRTNHSLRATTCTLGLERGVPEKLIMQRTGHRSVKSLHSYQRVSEKQKQIVSDVLQGAKREFSSVQDSESSESKRVCHRSIKEAEAVNFNNCSFNINIYK